jgi:hypothetical protein
VLAIFFVALATRPARADETRIVRSRSVEDHYRTTTLDLNLEGGAGYFWGNQSSAIGFGRVRTGVLFTGYPYCMSIGATFEVNNLSMATIGAQVELLHIPWGLWAQLGALADGRANFGGLLSIGWSIFGVEAQIRGYDEVRPASFNGGYGFAFFGKIRIPLGFIFYALSR